MADIGLSPEALKVLAALEEIKSVMQPTSGGDSSGANAASQAILGNLQQNNLAIRTVTASGNVALADAWGVIRANHATVAIVMTIPNDTSRGWVGGVEIKMVQEGAAAASFLAGGSVTVLQSANIPAAAVGRVLTAKRIGTNLWMVY